MKVLRLSTSQKKYGGNIYEFMIDKVLAEKFDYAIDQFQFKTKGFWRLLEVPLYFWHQYRFCLKKDFFRIRSFQSAYFNYRGKGLSIIYHIDSSHSPFLSKAFQDFNEKIFFWRQQKNEPLVVIADFWRQYFLDRGYTNVHLIHCGYDLKEYELGIDEVAKFRIKHGLGQQKIIYIGNLQRKKGADLAYQALRDEGFTLVTTGVKDFELPVLHLDLGFREYLCLLKTSEVVVTFSQFLEGWNRVAHEAMILGTPVVGSGMGGMGELLQGGGQILCQDPAQLKTAVLAAMSRRAELSANGERYARQFSIEKFGQEWQGLVLQLNEGQNG